MCLVCVRILVRVARTSSTHTPWYWYFGELVWTQVPLGSVQNQPTQKIKCLGKYIFSRHPKSIPLEIAQ